MKERELRFVLQEGEGLNVEFKESPKHLEEEMVALLKPLTPKTIGTVAVRRNPLLAELLHRIKYVEKMGTGFQRMKEACAAAKVTLRVEADGYFLIRFIPQSEKTAEKIIALIIENPDITTTEMSQKLGITIKGMEFKNAPS